MRQITIGLVALALLAVAGCTNSAPDTHKSNLSSSMVQTYDYDIPAAELVQQVKKTLPEMGLPIAKQNGSVLITDYKTYPGSWHILRRWQERTQYRITIYPDAVYSNRQSHLEITSQTETRATDQEPWHDWPEYQRPQRAAAVAQALRDRIHGSMASSATSSAPPVPTQATPDMETVLVTYHVIPGKEQELNADLSKIWRMYQQENLVVAEPHVIVRQKDADGSPKFVEIFSWVNHQAPDQVSESIKKIWDQMQSNCQPRNGRPGIDIAEVSLVAPSGAEQ